MNNQTQKTKETNTRANGLERLVRWFGITSIVPALILPFYQQFLHGGRDAASISARSAAYAEAHMLGAVCSLFLMFGLIAIYIKHAERIGKFGLIGFMIALFAQGLWAGNLFVDGFFNPLLAKFDPVLQTQGHSPEFFNAFANNNTVGLSFFLLPLTSVLYVIGYTMLGAAVARAGIMPRLIGILLMLGGLLMGLNIWTPMWVEVIGYTAIGGAVAWAGYLLWKDATIVEDIN